MKSRNWSLGPQATANFGLVLIVLVFNCIVVHRNTVALNKAQQSINRIREGFLRSQTVFSTMNEAENHVRGFVITGDESLPPLYHESARAIPDQMNRLREAVYSNTDQLARANEIARHLESRLAQLASIIQILKEQGFEAARQRVIEAEGTNDVKRDHQFVNEFRRQEDDLLAEQTRAQENRYIIVLSANLIAFVISVTITIVAWYLVERELGKRRAAEARADLERQNLAVTLTSIADGVIVCDAEGRVKLANPIAIELLGRPANVIGQPLSQLFTILDEKTGNALENPGLQLLSRGQFVAELDQTILRRVDGSEFPAEQSAAAIRDAAGKLTGVVLVIRDRSARRQIEREMAEREKRFRRVFESPLIGIAIGTSQGNLLEANDVYLDLIGYRRAELDLTNVSWDGKPHGQSPLDENAQSELRETGICKPFERTYTRTDGTRVPVLISAARLMDELNRIVIFVIDLSQSKRAEAALRESEARFRVLSECMPQEVWTAQPDGGIDYLNNMLIDYAGRPRETLIGWGWVDLIHPDDREVHLDAWKQSIATGDMFEIEDRVLKHSGEYRWHLSRALPVYKPGGETAMWVGTNTDIHDQKMAEETLREEHHRKDQFLALLAHELRNPLAPLSNAIQVFPSVQADAASVASLIGIMQRQVRQMMRLIDDLLDLARITTGRMRLQREKITAASVVAAAIEAVQPLINEREHELNVSVPKDDLWLDVDGARLSQVLTNLLHNAAKYTNSKGKLELTVERSGASVLFRVRDNGPGISKEMLTRIFDLFMQVDLTLDRAHGGLGIGLTLVRTLVELHRGTVSASSAGLGHGSEFVVCLPLLNESSHADAPIVPAATAPAALPGLKVLVVDDVRASAKTFALMLKTIGQDVEVAFDGPTAIDLATTSNFDLIFLDIAMPGMDGLEVARRLRSIPALDKVILVALTGFGQDEDRAHSLEAGFNHHLIKPTSLDILKEVVSDAALKRHH